MVELITILIKVIDLRRVLLLLVLSLSVLSLAVEFLPLEMVYSATSLAVSPDGSRLVSGYIDNTVKVWNLTDGTLINNLSLHSSWVTAVAVSRDGNLGIAGYDDGMIRLWNLSTGQAVKSFSSHTSSVNCLIVSEDGKTLYSAGSDGTIKIWSITELAFIRTLRGHSGPVNDLVHWPAQNRLYSVSDDGTLRIWDTSTNQQVRLIRGEIGALSSVAMDEGRSVLIVGSQDGPIKFYDVKTWNPIRTVKAHNAEVTTISIEGDRVFTSSRDRTIKILTLSSGSLIKMITGHRWDVSSIQVSSERGLIYSSSMDGTVKIWDLENSTELGTLVGFGDGEYFSYSPDGRWLSSDLGSSRVKTIDGSQPERTARVSSGLILQIEKLPRIYGTSPQYINLDSNLLRFSVSKPVVKVLIDGKETEFDTRGEVEAEVASAGSFQIKAYDSTGSFDERTIEVLFEETYMYFLKDSGPYVRGDRVAIGNKSETQFLVNGEWFDMELLSKVKPDTEKPRIDGLAVQLVTLGSEMRLKFSVSDNTGVELVRIESPDSRIQEVSVEAVSSNLDLRVYGTGDYLVTAIDFEGNEKSMAFKLIVEETIFRVAQDYGTLRRGQEVLVTAEGETSFYIKEYGWVEKDILTQARFATEAPVIHGERTQYIPPEQEKLLSFRVSDDVRVAEVEVLGKVYPVNMREMDMFILVNDYGEYTVRVRDVEGNSTEETFKLLAPSKSMSMVNWKSISLVVAIAGILLILLFRRSSSRKRRRKIRL
jgi:WD40 repeat protein